MYLGTFLRLRRSLATSALYAAVRIPAERFCVIGTKFPITQKTTSARKSHAEVILAPDIFNYLSVSFSMYSSIPLLSLKRPSISLLFWQATLSLRKCSPVRPYCTPSDRYKPVFSLIKSASSSEFEHIPVQSSHKRYVASDLTSLTCGS